MKKDVAGKKFGSKRTKFEVGKEEEQILANAKEKRRQFIQQKEDTKAPIHSILKPEREPSAPKKQNGGIELTQKTSWLTNKPYSNTYFEILKKRMTLPAWEARQPILELLEKNRVVVLQGETGSGKTTQIPQFLLQSKYRQGKLIACTQPRRVAAMSVAKRVSEELDVVLGEEVGYSIRFDDKSSPKTLLKYLTDGMLLREAMSDPMLTKYGVIILDEAHERTLSTDILFGLIKELMSKRKDLYLLVMSATMDTKKFMKYFVGAPLLDIPGRMHPVEIIYSEKATSDYYESAVQTALRIHKKEKPGEVYGVVYVVDPGMAKQKVYNPRIRVESLLVCPISKASAKQRAGRAGRTKPGKCYRLYTEKAHDKELEENTIPEILRSNLSSVILTLLKLGVKDLVHFDFIDPPAPETLMRALETLNYLGAIDEEGAITQLGNDMSDYPLDPQLSRMLLKAPEHKVVDAILSIVSVLNVPSIFLRPKDKIPEADEAKKKFSHPDGDYITYLNCFYAFQQNEENKQWCWDNYLNYRSLKAAESIRQQLKRIMEKQSKPMKNIPFSDAQYYPNIKCCILEGFFLQIAHLEHKGHYQTLKDNQIVLIHPSSVMEHRPEWVLYHEFVTTSKNYIRTVLEVKPEWFFKLKTDYFDLEEFPECEAKRSLVRVMNRRKKIE